MLRTLVIVPTFIISASGFYPFAAFATLITAYSAAFYALLVLMFILEFAWKALFPLTGLSTVLVITLLLTAFLSSKA